MTPEDKELLLKDLCARLPYGVKVKATYLSFSEDKLETQDINLTYYNVGYLDNHWIEAKPYLRPMSSMTDEELKEFGRLKHRDNEDWEIVEMWVVKHDFLNIKCRHKHHEDSTWVFQVSRTEPLRSWKGIDWLNAHHFDYRGLIPMGLALEAKEGMYNIE